ncbi:MAG: hypothetical protein RIG82_06310 [Phycisphaeraceae bacterium]
MTKHNPPLKISQLDALGAVILLAILVTGGFVISSILSNTAAEIARQQQQETEAALATSQTELRSVEKQRDDLLLLTQEGSNQLLTADALNRRLRDLANLLKQLDHRAERIEPADPALQDGFVIVPLQTQTSATYTNARKLFDRLGSDFPDLRITEFNLSTASDTPTASDSPMTLTLGMTWYATPPTDRIASGLITATNPEATP